MQKEIRQRVAEDRSITDFQRRVYLELLNVPRGETISYGELARRIGCRSAQAIGQALKRNPFAPEVPCHRVVAASWKGLAQAADGAKGIGGFHGQREGEMIEKKLRMLREERGCREC